MAHKVKVAVTVDRHTDAQVREIASRWDMTYSAFVDFALEAAVQDVELLESNGFSQKKSGSFVRFFWWARGEWARWVRENLSPGDFVP